MENTDEQVQKDMSQEYAEKLSHNLDEIEECKRGINEDLGYVVSLKTSLHSLYFKLYPKMTKEERTEQTDFNNKCNEINVTTQQQKGGRVYTLFNPTTIIKLNGICEERELHLRIILERLGLTAIQKQKRKVY